MYILTDGKNYVMENPMQIGKYLSTTSIAQASKFTYKQARAILNSKKSSMKFCKNYTMLDCDTGEESALSANYRGNADIYTGDNKIDFDESILDDIFSETDGILGLAAWDKNQLETYKTMLNSALSYYDSAISDIVHAIEKSSPPAHIRTKIYGVLQDVREKHTKVKQCIRYIEILNDAITYKYDLGKIKLEISKAKYVEYRGRTDYYKMIMDMVK